MLISEQLYIVFAVKFYGGINSFVFVFFKPSLLLFLHFVIMPRSLIDFYLYKYLRYEKKSIYLLKCFWQLQ